MALSGRARAQQVDRAIERLADAALSHARVRRILNDPEKVSNAVQKLITRLIESINNKNPNKQKLSSDAIGEGVKELFRESYSLAQLRHIKKITSELIKERVGEKKGTKPGPKGNKIPNALAKVPTEPVLATTFCKDHDISLTTIRQISRFRNMDPIKKPPIQVRKPFSNGPIYIWRGKRDLLQEYFRIENGDRT